MDLIKPKCGIVCEYNPFHNGHAYHIQKTKEATGAEIVCVMSGDFVQRAEPAIFDKRVRARAAIDAGADAVIELPAVYSTAGAEQFAYGAISVMAAVKGLKYISFGVETDNVELLKAAAEIQLNESTDFKAVLKDELRRGASYAAAIAFATAAEYGKIRLSDCEIKRNLENGKNNSLPLSGTPLLNPSLTRATPLKLGENLGSLLVNENQPQPFNSQSSILNEFSQLLKAPNNILAIEYLKAIKSANLDITPIFTKRTDGGYNSNVLTPPFAAAGAIRGLIASGKPYTDFTPMNYGNSPVDFKVFEALTRQAILKESHRIIDKSLLRKLKNGAQKYSTLDEIIKYCKSKNNTYAAIKRAIFHVMSDITCDILNYKGIFYAKLLAIKKSFKASLKDLNDNILISSTDEKRILSNEENTQNPYPLRIYNIDKYTSDLYAVITNQDSNRYFKLI